MGNEKRENGKILARKREAKSEKMVTSKAGLIKEFNQKDDHSC